MWPFTGGVAVGFDCGSSETLLRNLKSEQNLPFSLVFDGQKSLYGLYGVNTVSTFLILDEGGVVRYRREGFDQRTIMSVMRTLMTD